MTKSEKIKAEIEQLINQLKKDLEKSNHPLIDISVSERIATLEEVLSIINEIPDDEPQQPQPISVPFVRIVDDCVAKCCWEHGGVCINPHRDCIDCPKNWNLGFNTYTSNKIEGNISADPKDWHVVVKSKISEDTTWKNDKTTWTEKDEDMLSECIGAVMAADWYSLEDKEEIKSWLQKKFGKNEKQ